MTDQREEKIKGLLGLLSGISNVVGKPVYLNLIMVRDLEELEAAENHEALLKTTGPKSGCDKDCLKSC